MQMSKTVNNDVGMNPLIQYSARIIFKCHALLPCDCEHEHQIGTKFVNCVGVLYTIPFYTLYFKSCHRQINILVITYFFFSYRMPKDATSWFFCNFENGILFCKVKHSAAVHSPRVFPCHWKLAKLSKFLTLSC